MTLPRVTEVLRAVGLTGDFSTVDPAVLDAARERGTRLHAACEAHQYGIDVDLPPALAGYFSAYLRFCDDTKHAPVVSEYAVTHERWRYHGHLDRIGFGDIADFAGHRTVYDWKTGEATGAQWQVCAYAEAWNAMRPTQPVERGAIVQLRADGTYRLTPVDLVAARPVWYAALTVYHARFPNGVTA